MVFGTGWDLYIAYFSYKGGVAFKCDLVGKYLASVGFVGFGDSTCHFE